MAEIGDVDGREDTRTYMHMLRVYILINVRVCLVEILEPDSLPKS
jgi:hypothetical protein